VLGESENMGDVNDMDEAWHHVTYFKIIYVDDMEET
jgi:hypothetical protein